MRTFVVSKAFEGLVVLCMAVSTIDGWTGEAIFFTNMYFSQSLNQTFKLTLLSLSLKIKYILSCSVEV